MRKAQDHHGPGLSFFAQKQVVTEDAIAFLFIPFLIFSRKAYGSPTPAVRVQGGIFAIQR